jgi:hypothetical protein
MNPEEHKNGDMRQRNCTSVIHATAITKCRLGWVTDTGVDQSSCQRTVAGLSRRREPAARVTDSPLEVANILGLEDIPYAAAPTEPDHCVETDAVKAADAKQGDSLRRITGIAEPLSRIGRFR